MARESVNRSTPPSRPTVNVIAPHFPYGMLHSGEIVTRVLNEAGFRARFLYFDDGRRSRLRQWLHRSWFGKFLRRDVNIFMEQLSQKFFNMARVQFLIPNQEWIREEDDDEEDEDDEPHLTNLDLIICKSRHAGEIFSKLGCRTAFSSFTSMDRRLAAAGPKRREFFLMAGDRPVIVERVIALWARHPEWPTLTVSGNNVPDNVNLPNVCPIRKYLPMEEIVRLQNANLFHLCITTAEGFGHKLNEGMSCGAVVIATDGPPMNELIRPERGFLVKWARTSPKALGTEYHFDEEDLERTVERCLGLSAEEIDRLAANARSWFEENDLFFRKALPEIVRNWHKY